MDDNLSIEKKISMNSQHAMQTDESHNASGSKVRNVLDEVSKKDFFDFMRTAYQVYECVEGNVDMPNRPTIDWDELEKNPVIKLLLENLPCGSEEITIRRCSEGGSVTNYVEGASSSSSSKHSSNNLDVKDQTNLAKGKRGDFRRNSVSGISRKGTHATKTNTVDLEESFIDSALKSKLSDILNEGILDSVLPYVNGTSKPSKPPSGHQPIIKKTQLSTNETKKTTTFNEQEIKEKPSGSCRIGRRKSSTGGDKSFSRGDGEVEIHVCDEVKGLKKDFKCPQKLLVSKMGYFADVTSGQKLEDMDISVHCDIQIFDWLMRWVKKDSILQGDWPKLDSSNVIPILVSASFLQMDPLLHDCLIYCHSNMSDIVKTNTNLSCLNDTILTRLGAMYTNSELEAIKDRKDKIQSRLFCKMIISLGEPVFETLRGHYASLATLYKCNKCNKLLPRQIADRIPCVPSSMTINHWGHIMSSHARDLSWNLSEYITQLHVELKSWRKVYWRLWGECHFLKCLTCDNYFPVYQMEWCCYHADMPQFFSLEPTRPTCLPIGRYSCCGERAYRFQILNMSTQGCQFREHCSEQKSDSDVAILGIYNEYKEVICVEPPHLVFPERLTRLVPRESNAENGRLLGKEVFWWEGIKLAPPRQPLGLLGKLYSGSSIPKKDANKPQQTETSTNTINKNTNFVQHCPPLNVTAIEMSNSILSNVNIDISALEGDGKSEPTNNVPSTITNTTKDQKTDIDFKDDSSSDSDEIEESDTSTGDSSHSEESSPARIPVHRRGVLRKRPRFLTRRRMGMGGRQWAAALSARSNQDQQRQYEERVARQMRSLLAKRAAVTQSRPTQPLGGVFVRLEAEWREANIPPVITPSRPTRHVYSAKGVRAKTSK